MSGDCVLNHEYVFVPAISILKTKYQSTMYESKRLNGTGMAQARKLWRAELRCDKLLYQYAVQQVSGHFRAAIQAINANFVPTIAVENGRRR